MGDNVDGGGERVDVLAPVRMLMLLLRLIVVGTLWPKPGAKRGFGREDVVVVVGSGGVWVISGFGG